MKRKKKLLLSLLTAVLLVIFIFPVSANAAASKTTPQKVTLTKISASAYNKINIKWKKAAGATHYKIYYKKSGSSKWTYISTISGKSTSYTHTSSSKKPIIVGQKYTYSVKGYNSSSKRSGKYDAKGLTTRTLPPTVKLQKAALNSKKDAVTVSWSKTGGCSHYAVYRKTPSSGWKRLANLSTKYSSYTDKSPVKGQKNIYTVRSYYSKTKVYGSYNSKGLSVTVPKPPAKPKVTPQKVVLDRISAPAYNKINIKWKKATGATHYKIYYKKSGSSKWTYISTVSSKYTSYTHASSTKTPIVVGQKYIYTVRGYNSTSKLSGKYDSKGLTARTIPPTVKLQKASLNSKKNAVTISWSKTGGCNYYVVYRKTPSSGWKRLANLSTKYSSYTDKSPVKGQTNIYTVRSYYSKTKVYGGYNAKGLSVKVPGTTAPTAKYKYEIKVINPYKDLYTNSSGSPILYVKTNNPDSETIVLYSNPRVYTHAGLPADTFADVKGNYDGLWLKVEGGYLFKPLPEKAGTYTFRVGELKEEYRDDWIYAGLYPSYCYETNASVTFKVRDYKEGLKDWINSLIKKYTKSDMTPKEKFRAIIYGEFGSFSSNPGSRYRYLPMIYDESRDRYITTSLLSEIGTVWQNGRMDSYSSPRLMCDIGYMVGYPVKGSSVHHAYVEGPDGDIYVICPMTETGYIKNVKPFDFSKY